MLFWFEAAADAQEELLSALEDAEVAQEYAVIVLSEQAKDRLALQGASRGSARRLIPVTSLRNNSVQQSKAATAGLVVIHPSELDTVLSATVGPSAPLDELLEPLTRREREVLQMLAAGPRQ